MKDFRNLEEIENYIINEIRKNHLSIDSEYRNRLEMRKSDFYIINDSDEIYFYNNHSEDDYLIELSDNEIKIYQFLYNEDYDLINESLDDIIQKEINLINK